MCFRFRREADSTDEVRCRSEELLLSMDDVEVDRRRSIDITTGTVGRPAVEDDVDRRLEMGACVSICFPSRSSSSESSCSVSFVSEGRWSEALLEEDRLDSVVVLPTVVVSFSSMLIEITPDDNSSALFVLVPLDIADFPEVCDPERDLGRDCSLFVEG